MDWKSVAEEWKPFRNQVRTHWQLLSEGQLEAIAGRRVHLAEQLCRTYGISADEAERQILNFEARDHFFRRVSER